MTTREQSAQRRHRLVVPTDVAQDGAAFGFDDDPRFWLEAVECESTAAADQWDARVWREHP